MKAQFRPTTPQDAPAIAAFLGRIFDARPGDLILDPAMMHWKFWQPHPDWSGSRSFVLEREGSILAHGAAWPARILGSGRIPSFFLIDWAASPESPGAGVSIMKHMAQIAPVNFLYGGTEVARKMRFAMGYRPLNDIYSLALPVRPLRQILTSRRNWKTPARLARNLAWSRARLPAGQWHSRSVEPGEIEAAGLEWASPRPGWLTSERNPALFQYLAGCPAVLSRFFLAESASRQAGYFSVTFPPGQARIADAWTPSQELDDWVELYSLAVDQVRRHPGVNEIIAATTGDPALAALKRCGFHVRATEPAQLYDPQKLVPSGLPLDLQLIDGDAAFRYSSGADYLT